MILHDAILQYDRGETIAIVHKSAEKNILLKLSLKYMGSRTVDVNVAKSQVLLDAAYRLQDSGISEKDLDYLINELGKVDAQTFEFEFKIPQLLAARKEWIKARVEFYQQIVQQEGTAENFEDAVKKQFGNEASYREALQPVLEAERKMSDIIKEEVPVTADAMDATLDAVIEVQETLISHLFPR